MQDTKHSPSAPTEGDGVSYSGIVGFAVVLVAVVAFCQLFVWGLFGLMESRVAKNDTPRSPLAAERARPEIKNGTVMTGPDTSLPTPLLVDEPLALGAVRRADREALTQYKWQDQAAETVRLPIERAKALLLERGLPVRPTAAPVPEAPATAAAVAPAGETSGR